MSDEPLRYCVLIGKPEDFRPVDIARAMAALKKVPQQDLVPGLRRSWGIVAEDLEEREAKTVAAALDAAGLSALAVPKNLLDEPVAPRQIPTMLPFKPERLVLLAAAGFKQTTKRTVTGEEGPDLTKKAIGMGITMITGMPTSLGGGKKEVQRTVESTDLVFFADLILKDPAERFRVDAQDFDFSCLGARKVYAALINFRQLVCDLADASPQAVRSRGTAILLDQKPVREMGYESLSDLERECRWLLTLSSLKRA